MINVYMGYLKVIALFQKPVYNLSLACVFTCTFWPFIELSTSSLSFDTARASEFQG
jgi:hypothetical protein